MNDRFIASVLFAMLLTAATPSSAEDAASRAPALPATVVSGNPKAIPIPLDAGQVADGLVYARNPITGLAPSHPGHPGYENLGFLYDLSVSAMVLNAAGRKQDAEVILDYFARRLSIPTEEAAVLADTNGVFGVIKLVKSDEAGGKKLKALVNAIDIGSRETQGRGLLEFYTTPGPMAFMIFAMLQVDRKKYAGHAEELGDVILTMQDKEGGVRDGDRSPDRVHTEPQMDTAAAFMMLYNVTGEQKWFDAATRAHTWFMGHVYNRYSGAIYQGIWLDRPSRIFATDVYSWTMAGPAGDSLSSEELKRLTDKMLSGCLVKVTVELPDGRRPTVILADFSDPDNPRVMNSRLGRHPMGTIEWTGGVVLALQKNAVRLWQRGDTAAAKRYKALADLLLAETARCFYGLGDGAAGLTTFYSTAQGVEIAPFGSIENKSTSGWHTTFFYAKGPDGTPLVRGGASIGAWVLLPLLGVNPFILNDPYKAVYDTIPLDDAVIAGASAELEGFVKGREHTEETPVAGPDRRVQIVEPRMFNKHMWQSLERGFEAKRAGDAPRAHSAFSDAIFWASKVLQNRVWLSLARSDNEMKMKEFGGIIRYPWGANYPGNDHPLHFAIQRYPLLNEVGTAAWGMATAAYELGDAERAGKWVEKIITDYPLHQIAAVHPVDNDLIIGYWNALVSWEERTLGIEGNMEMYEFYKEVLSGKKMASARPKTVMMPGSEKEFRSDMSGPEESDAQRKEGRRKRKGPLRGMPPD